MDVRYLFDAVTGDRLAVASPAHVKARDVLARDFRPGLLLVDEVLDVVEPGCPAAATARAVFVCRG